MEQSLADLSPEWRMKAGDKEQNQEIRQELDYLYRLIRASMQ
jgi:hypothetical protein